MGRSWLSQGSVVAICAVAEILCRNLFAGLMDWDITIDRYDRFDVFASHFPSGTSV